MAAVDVSGEFETIQKLLVPLAHPEWARGLMDDVAVLPSRAGFDLVLTKDAIVEGVHFLAEDPLDTVAQKLLRVNLSDLAAKGAAPHGYLLSVALPSSITAEWLQAFAQGLAQDQAQFGITLLGGDTARTEGPLSISGNVKSLNFFTHSSGLEPEINNNPPVLAENLRGLHLSERGIRGGRAAGV